MNPLSNAGLPMDRNRVPAPSSNMLQAPSAANASQITETCRSAGYLAPKLEELFGFSIPPPHHHPQAADFAAATPVNSAFTALARLFFLGLPVEEKDLRSFFPQEFVNACFACGLIDNANGIVTAQALLIPVDQWYLTSDVHPTNIHYGEHYVPTLSQPAMHLFSFAIKKAVGSTLDLCGGCGPHAMAASRFSETVMTADSNYRAAEFVDFNAALNGFTNIEAVTGDLFLPVKGRTFDLILCNPPFVISPSTSSGFRDNEFELDFFLEKILREVPDHLAPGGFFQTTCEWVQVQGEEWQERLDGWLQNNGCDAWILEANCQLPESYARNRLRETSPSDNTDVTSLENYLHYFNERNVEAIRGGLIFLHKREGPNWRDFSNLREGVRQPIGEAVLQGFMNRDLIHSTKFRDSIMKSRLVICKGIQQHEHSHWDGVNWTTDAIRLQNGAGIPCEVVIDKQVRSLLNEFTGSRTVTEILQQFSDKHGMSRENAESRGIDLIRLMLEQGIITLMP
ncbi:MAG: methyltransferase [Pirellulales bacterium]